MAIKKRKSEFGMAMKKTTKSAKRPPSGGSTNVSRRQEEFPPDPWIQLRIAEYSTLREELLQNKRYVFERPLVIVAAVGFAVGPFKDNPWVFFLPSFLISILIVNLWFTVNRLLSTARIASYIDAVVEPNSSFRWIGWEKAIALHREWTKSQRRERTTRERLHRLICGETTTDNLASKPDTMATYQVVLYLHAVPIAFAAFASCLLCCYSDQVEPVKDPASLSAIATLAFAATLIALFIFIWLVSTHWKLKNMANLVAKQHAVWEEVLKKETKNGTTEDA